MLDRRRFIPAAGLLALISISSTFANASPSASFHQSYLVNVNRYLDNPEQFLDRKLEPQFNAIGQVETPARALGSQEGVAMGRGTAFLVSPCYILTNNHVVFWSDFPDYPKSEEERRSTGERYRVIFKVSVGVHLPFAVGAYAVPVAWGDRNASDKNDWALLRLSSCLGERPEVGWMELDVNESSIGLKGYDVAVAGYPFDRGNATAQDQGKQLSLSWGRVTGYNRDNDTIRYSASAVYGMSGSPVMMTDESGRVRVIGVHRSGFKLNSEHDAYQYRTYAEDFSNEFLNIRAIIESQNVQTLLLADIARFGRGNPNDERIRRGMPRLRSAPAT